MHDHDDTAPLSGVVPQPRPVDGGGASDPGGAGAPLLRLTDADFADGLGAMTGGDRPNPREVSNAVFRQEAEIPEPNGFSDLLWAWGQYLDHDLSLSEAKPGGEPANIPIPAGDDPFDPEATGEQAIRFLRVTPIEDSGEDGPRAYENDITAYLDASQVYGSTPEQRAAIRVEGGKVLLDEEGLLVFNPDGTTIAGDVRAGDNSALAGLHTIFAREHNRIVDELRAADPTLGDDAVFEAARMRVEAIQQAITYNEWLPRLVGPDAIPDYDGYDPEVSPQVSVEFSTGVFRLGHTLLSQSLERFDEAGNDVGTVALRDAFFTSPAQKVDAQVIEEVRSFLLGPLVGPAGGPGFDLVALNIQRGRDLALPSYNELRAGLGLERAETFSDITADADRAGRLEAVYGDVDRVDAWVGGISEDPAGDSLVGELFTAVIVDQFTRVRAADPYWSETRGLDPALVEELWSTTLSDVILRNTDVAHLQEHAFDAYARRGGGADDDRMGGTWDSDLLLGFAGDDRLKGRGGDDHLEGGAGDDRLRGGRGDDALYGGDGDDRLRGGRGDDALHGGDGDDRMTGGRGADLFVFSARADGRQIVTDFEAEDAFRFEDLRAGEEVAWSLDRNCDPMASVGDLVVIFQNADHGAFDGLV
jgi:hypothetical protein